MNLNTNNWKEFRFGDLTSNIYKAKSINRDDLNEATDIGCAIRYITRTGENNGCELLADAKYIDSKIIEKKNAISIGDTTATCFYQDEDFITGDHMVIVRADHWLNKYTALFILAILNNEKFKYSYGRAFLMDRIANTTVKLPIDLFGNPNWQFMEDYIKSLHHKPLTTKNKSGQAPNLNVKNWGEFTIPELFGEVKIAKSADIGNLEDGMTPFVGRTDVDNGVQGFVVPSSVTDGRCITVSMVGTNVALYQENDFQASQNIAILRKSGMTKAIALFICSMINFEMALKYSYGRTVGKTNIERMILKLPVTSIGEPDWEFMENYIKSLPYGDRL